LNQTLIEAPFISVFIAKKKSEEALWGDGNVLYPNCASGYTGVAF
jgi:hypothetical protein